MFCGIYEQTAHFSVPILCTLMELSLLHKKFQHKIRKIQERKEKERKEEKKDEKRKEGKRKEKERIERKRKEEKRKERKRKDKNRKEQKKFTCLALNERDHHTAAKTSIMLTSPVVLKEEPLVSLEKLMRS